MKHTWFTIILFSVVSVCLQAQTERSVTVTKPLEKVLKANDTFKKAVDVITDFEVSVNFASGKLFKTDEKNYTVKYELNDPRNLYDYKSIVYATENGKSFSYFEDKKQVNVADSAQKRLACKWSDWTNANVGTECHRNIWCSKANKRQATYRWETRSKTCNGVVTKVVSRLVKDHCGC